MEEEVELAMRTEQYAELKKSNTWGWHSLTHFRLFLLACTVLFMVVSARPAFANAVTAGNVTSVNLTVNSTKSDLEGTLVRLYRVAEFTEDAQYTLADRYAGYIGASQFDGSSNEKLEAGAQTLAAYVGKDNLTSDYAAKVSDGRAVFTSIPSGLYLLMFDVPAGSSYKAVPILQSLPYQFSGNQYVTDISMDMKPEAKTHPNEHHDRQPGGSSYKVQKIWSGDVKKTRPVSISVTIYKDGTEYKTVTLNSGNNWRYSWSDASDSDFSVVENDVPEGYTVSITSDDTTFTIENTGDTPGTPHSPNGGDQPETTPGGSVEGVSRSRAPEASDSGTETPSSVLGIARSIKTGDDSRIMLWALLLCGSGIAMVVYGSICIRHVRRRK
jgi:hypothetical protein